MVDRLERLRNPLVGLFAALLLTGLALAREAVSGGQRQTERRVASVERRLQALDEDARIHIEDARLIASLAHHDHGEAEPEPDVQSSLFAKPWSIYVFEEDSLVWWSRNDVVPPAQAVVAGDAPRFLRLRNGYYLARASRHAEMVACALVPVRTDFTLNNPWLQPTFSAALEVPATYTLGPAGDPERVAVHDADGNELFRLGPAPMTDAPVRGGGGWALHLAALGAWLLFLYALAARWARYGYAVPAFAFLVMTLASSRLLMHAFAWPAALLTTPLFDPHYYATPGIAASLGDLLLDLLAWLIATVFFLRHGDAAGWSRRLRIPGIVSATVLVALVAMLIALAVRVMRGLVLDASIAFRLDEFFQLQAFSFAGLLSIGLLFLLLYLAGRRLLHAAFDLAGSGRNQLLAAVAGFAVYVAVTVAIAGTVRATPLVWAVLFVGLAGVFRARAVPTASYAHAVTWIAFFAVFATGLLLRANALKDQRNQRSFAERQAKDQDPVMEYLFAGVSGDIAADPFVRNVLRNPFRGTRAGDEQIAEVHLGSYFNRFEVEVDWFNAADRRIGTAANSGRRRTRSSLDSLIRVASEPTSVEGLHHVSTDGEPFYLAAIDVPYGEAETGRVYLRFTRRTVSDNSIYPELLLEDAGVSAGLPSYDYAVYRDGLLVKRGGETAWPFHWRDDLPEPGRFAESRVEGRERLVYAAAAGKVVVVETEREDWLGPVSLFSYLFLFLLLFALIAVALSVAVPAWIGGESVGRRFTASLRGKIQSLVVLLIIGSFLVIGAVTLIYFSTQYDDYHRSRLLRKLRAVESEITYQAQRGDEETRRQHPDWPFDRGLDADLRSVSEIHRIDVNVYDLHGALVASSQPDIFDKGLISRRMEPRAWHLLHEHDATQHLQPERIGRLDFLGAYAPLQTRAGQTAGYLHLPYFAKERNLRQEISAFMTALINVYVLLLVVAGLVALFLSNSITRSLALIGAQFQKVQLGGGNEPIAWSGRDEIGMLVGEYNKMLGELERSAQLLARSERESAWREMAKQVAHEIKNPLTPMRLSIQHLQRAWAADDPRADELARRMARTLLEQIESLSRIATEFSDFAKMPQAQRERIRLDEVLTAALDLYRDDEHFPLEYHEPREPVWVMADRHQMIRVFNNLVKNAIQAIPDDREPRVRVEVGSFDGAVEVRVIDNGTGIPEDRRDQVFVPNFTTKSSGMGLGLAMCKNIVESAGGRIWFETVVDEGTTFHVELPQLPHDNGIPETDDSA